MGTERMADSDFAAWMQEEHKALAALTKVLRSHIAAVPEGALGTWLDSLKAGFGRLKAHLERNFDAQESEGYLSHLVESRPALAGQIERSKQEHAELRRLAERIAKELNEIRPAERLLVQDACARIEHFAAIVAQHEQRENMIAMFVFNEDIGGD